MKRVAKFTLSLLLSISLLVGVNPLSLHPFSQDSAIGSIAATGASVDVRTFGAKGDGINDDTAAIQKAINAASLLGVTKLGATVYFSPGLYKVTSSLIVGSGAHVSFLGEGRVSGLTWFGGNGLPILYFNKGSADIQLSVEKLYFLNGNASTGSIGIRVGLSGGGAGLENVTVRKCMFQGVATAVETWTETDEFTFVDNWVLAYTGAAVWARGGTNSAYRIRDNHFQGGGARSWAIQHDGGSNILIDGNTIESGTAGAKGIALTGANDFRVTNTYFEVNSVFGVRDGPFLAIAGSTDGVVEVNHTTGDTGNSVITVDATSSNIRFGPNRHGISAGTPTAFIAVTAGATDVFIYGKQDVSGGTFPAYSGTVSVYAAGGAVTAAIPVNQFTGPVNAGGGATVTLKTLPANSAYQVYARQFTEGYFSTAVVQRQAGGASISTPYNSNPNLTISASGNDLQATNGIAGKRTIEYSMFRLW